MADTPITDPYQVPVTFVSQLIGLGNLNGVFNLTFGTARFTPNVTGAVDPDVVVSARLRMDSACLDTLYESIGKLIQQQKPTREN